MKQKPSERIYQLAMKLVQGKQGMFVSDYIPLATLQYLDEQAELHAKSGQRYSADYQRTLLRNAEELHKQKDTETGKDKK